MDLGVRAQESSLKSIFGPSERLCMPPYQRSYSWGEREAGELLTDLLDVWLAPLREISPHGEPADEIGSYIRRKLESSRQFPRESRLFANEMLTGAPHIGDFLQSELKQLVDEKAAIFQGWIDEGRLAPCDPRHLLFAIWSTTQHYADFSVQVRHVLGLQPGDVSYYEEALSMLETLFLSRLVPPASTD